MPMKIKFRIVSLLEKIFPDKTPHTSPFLGKESILKGERYTFQIAFRGCMHGVHQRITLFPQVRGPLENFVTIRKVGFVPVQLARYATHDHAFLNGAKTGLYPDPLFCMDEAHPLIALNTQWNSIWVEFTPQENMQGGIYRIEVSFLDEDGIFCGTAGTEVLLIDKKLDAQKLICTDWLHADCISEYYHVDSLSDAHFTLMEQYINTAVRNGINMMLTPVFTPPLDTAVGRERPTVQLVKISVHNGRYTFDFADLLRFIDICRCCGVTYYEMPHLFTQWGAKAAPKIMAAVDGVQKRIFGWDTPAIGDAYQNFLHAFLPKLTEVLKRTGIAAYTFFHISDEPEAQHIDHYRAAAASVQPYLEGFTVIDALSDYDFYEKGLVRHPVPSNDHITSFLEHQVPHLWTYYCCAQGSGVSNRFIAMSGARSRVLALQLFKYDIEGFLHWGYNYWYSQFSRYLIDPYAVTDADLAFPSGDAFCVYPGENGPVESSRLCVFASALCDLRAMQMLARLKGKAAVMDIIEHSILPITFDRAPDSEDYILKTRIAVNQAIAETEKI